MPSRTILTIWIGANVILWFMILWILGTPLLSFLYLKPFGIVISLNVAFCSAFNWYIWACPFINKLIKRPDMRGTWRLTVTSSWQDPHTQTQIPPIIAYAIIRQTFSSFSLRVITKESSSKLISYSLAAQEDGLFILTAVFRNEPNISIRGVRSEIHYGSFILNIHGQPVDSLDGYYWTDRATKGSMSLTSRSNKLCETYEEASLLFEETR